MQAYDVVGGKNGSGGFIEVFNDRGEMLRVEGLEKLVRKSAQKALPGMKQAILDGLANGDTVPSLTICPWSLSSFANLI